MESDTLSCGGSENVRHIGTIVEPVEHAPVPSLNINLRDLFAGLAMQSLIVCQYEGVTQKAYTIADAMLKARGDG